VQNINLFPYSVYYYRIRAYNSAGYSSYSNTAGGRTALYSTLPAAPVRSDRGPGRHEPRQDRRLVGHRRRQRFRRRYVL